MKKIISSVVIITIIISVIHACKKNSQEETNNSGISTSNSSLIVKPDFCITTNQNSAWKNNIKSYNMNYNRYGVSANYTASLIDFTDEEMQSFCNPILSGTQNIFSVAIYLNSKDQINNLNPGNVNGFSIFVLENGNLKHKLFTKDITGYREQKDFAIDANIISTSNLAFILFNILPSDFKSQSYVFIKNETLMGSVKLTSNKDGFGLKKAVYGMNWYKVNKKYLLHKKNILAKAPTQPVGGGGPQIQGCGPEKGCENGGPLQLCIGNAFGHYTCDIPDPGTCPLSNAQIIIVNNGALTTEELLTDFNYDLSYNFRDNFLVPSYLGFKYAEDYYAIGRVVGSSFSLSTSLKMAYALPSIYIAVNKLMSPIGHEGDILVPVGFAADLHSIIDDFKALSSDSDYQAILSDLENDLDYFTGKTVSEILALF